MSPRCALFGKSKPTFMQESEELSEWYVLRVTYQRELIAKRRLDELGITSFVPTRKVEVRGASGVKRIQRKALVHNYIFVFSNKQAIDSVKCFELPYLRYVVHTQNNEKTLMRVPERQMRSFMLVTGSEDERLQLLQAESVDLKLGTKVRVVGGIFAGAEGILVKIPGSRSRRVVVQIDGVAMVATPAIEREFLEVIED